MKRLLASSFLMLYILATTSLIELIKLPTLIHHYHEHSKDNKNLSFTDFVYLHYMTNHSSSNEDSHSNLPFKSAKNITSYSIILHEVFSINNQDDYDISIFRIINHYKMENSFRLLDNIWHPPKV